MIDDAFNPFDHSTGAAAARVGQQRALDAADEDIKASLWASIQAITRTRRLFTSDHVWAHYQLGGGEPPREPRVLGGLLVQATKQGLCRQTGQKSKSQRRERHTGYVSVYESMVCGPDAETMEVNVPPASCSIEEVPGNHVFYRPVLRVNGRVALIGTATREAMEAEREAIEIRRVLGIPPTLVR